MTETHKTVISVIRYFANELKALSTDESDKAAFLMDELEIDDTEAKIIVSALVDYANILEGTPNV